MNTKLELLRELIWVPWFMIILLLLDLGNDRDRGESAVLDRL